MQQKKKGNSLQFRAFLCITVSARNKTRSALRPTIKDMPRGQKQVYGKGELHFITCTFYRQHPKMAAEKHRDLFVQLLEEIRIKFRFDVAGYVAMPTNFHLLMTEPGVDTADNSIQMLRQRFGRRYNTSARTDEQVWETHYADQHILGTDRIAERLNFMHQAPVRAGLVETATDWEWSSARHYGGLPEGVVTVVPSSGMKKSLLVPNK